MRIPLVYALSAALLLTSSCSRDEKPAPAATTATTPPTAPAATPAPAAPPKEVVFGVEELDQMVAPIALYPDPLLAQVLMASTYPGDVAEAAAWAKAHPDAKGDDAVRQVASQPWDPSVQSLAAFPQALATLGQDPAWVQRLGDAFLAQPDDVMDAVQRLRRQAQTAGNLESNEYQKVTVQPAAAPVAEAAPAAAPATGGFESAPATETIIIEPSNPETVYVPSYNPTTAYGNWAYPSYPPTYYPPPSSYYPLGGALATGLMFGVGVAAIDSLWGDADWDNGDIDIDVDSYNNINSNRQIDRSQNTFSHNAANRDGVPYRDRGNREANSRRLDGADGRTEFRGEDANRARSREQARASMERRGVDTPARTNQEARDRAQAASRETASRDQARDRAQATTRDRQQADRAQAGSRDQARDRAQASTQRQQQASRDSARSAQSRQQGAKHRQSQSNTQARSAARSQQQAQTRQAPKNNAFQGASRPQQSRASSQRGQSSHASAQRSQSSRSAGKPAQRQSRPPQQRQSGRR